MKFDKARQKWIFLVGGISCLLIAFCLTATFRGKFADPAVLQDEVLPEFDLGTPADTPTGVLENRHVIEKSWVVYVTGAVTSPGVYEISPDSRINDAVQKAGGFSSLADTEGINLASKAEDGMHIKVPLKRENDAQTDSLHEESEKNNSHETAARSTQAQKISKKGAGKICINTASARELQRLPGVGPKLSRTIVDYRNANGPFRETRQLLKVRGIGAKRFETLKDFVFISQ